ncbi:hypothetical protein ACQPT2_18140 [Erwinia amylovora]
MKQRRWCQRQIANLWSIAEKAAKALNKCLICPPAGQHKPPLLSFCK